MLILSDEQVSFVRKYLPLVDWLAWVDCDSFFMDDAKRLTDLIPSHTTHPDIDFVISEDGLTVNTGPLRDCIEAMVHSLSFLSSCHCDIVHTLRAWGEGASWFLLLPFRPSYYA